MFISCDDLSSKLFFKLESEWENCVTLMVVLSRVRFSFGIDRALKRLYHNCLRSGFRLNKLSQPSKNANCDGSFTRYSSIPVKTYSRQLDYNETRLDVNESVEKRELTRGVFPD